MRITSIEPTPNPNSMKLNMDESLPEGVSLSFTQAERGAAPPHLQRLLGVEGVRSVYQVGDFIALERLPKADWQGVLAGARQALESEALHEASAEPLQPLGRVEVFIQMLRAIPMQVKLRSGEQEVRVGLPERFGMAAKRVAMVGDLLAERRWVAKGARYGEMAIIGEEVAAEIAATYDEERLASLLAAALAQGPGGQEAEPPLAPLSPAEVAERLTDPDWRKRFAALDRLEPEEGALPVIIIAMADRNPSVRRLATVYLGEVKGPEALTHLMAALRDESPAVRRAAGDCLSDLGDPVAIGPMAEALQDVSKLVRWRAARYLYEVGDASALPALEEALADPEFEVALQVRMAIERIEEGRQAVEPAWKQMTRQWDSRMGS